MTVRKGIINKAGQLQSVFPAEEVATGDTVVDVPDTWPNNCAWDVGKQQFVPHPMVGEPPDLSEPV